MKDSSLIDKLLNEAAWKGKDAFPSTGEWREDVGHLLEFLENEGQLERLWPALTSERPRQRNAAIAEARVAGFLTERGCRIVDWTPELENGKTPEFEIRTPAGERVMVEVKAPDWQAELSPEERREGRTFEPKDKHAEVRTSSTMDHVKVALLKASKQLPAKIPALVAIVDDLYWSPAEEFPANVLVPTLEEFFKTSETKNVGGVLFLNPVKLISEKAVSLRVRFVPNTECEERCRSGDLENTLKPFIPEL